MTLSAAAINLSIANFRNQMFTSLMDLGRNADLPFGDILSQAQAGSDDAAAAFGSDDSSPAASADALLNLIGSTANALQARYFELRQGAAMAQARPAVVAAMDLFGGNLAASGEFGGANIDGSTAGLRD